MHLSFNYLYISVLSIHIFIVIYNKIYIFLSVLYLVSSRSRRILRFRFSNLQYLYIRLSTGIFYMVSLPSNILAHTVHHKHTKNIYFILIILSDFDRFNLRRGNMTGAGNGSQ